MTDFTFEELISRAQKYERDEIAVNTKSEIIEAV